jgi:hypothetical protein
MPRYIDYETFITPSGALPVAPIQPYEYASIYNGISDLLINDGIITFTGLPTGIVVATPESSTAPFDQVFVDLEDADDFVTLNLNGNYWSGSAIDSGGEGIICSYTSGGFWAMALYDGVELYSIIHTGDGDPNSSILDISFNPLQSELLENPINFAPGQEAPINLVPGATYQFDGDSSSITVPIQFNQTRNASWYLAQVNRFGGVSYGQLNISGVAFTGGSYQTVTIPSKSASATQLYNVKWLNGQLTLTSGAGQMAPDPFANFNYGGGYNVSAIIPNEIMSSYNIISSNTGNSGTASIQINNAQQFSDLPLPLRKLHVFFDIAEENP